MYSVYMYEHSESYPSLLQDEPIRSVTDDQYGRREYVRDLALALSRFPGPGSLVVGIQGPWGSGKTSLKNMLVEQLVAADFGKRKGKNQEERAIVVEFEPWMYSGSGRLVSLLFRQISQTLSGKSDVVKHAATKFVKSAAKVAPLIPSTAPVSGAAIAKSFNSFAEALEPSSEDSELLSKRRRKLEGKLKKSATRIVVFIDDLDRLMDDEVTDVMRAVKAVGDLPYMTYVLLYDRDSLTKSLDKSCHDKGDEYLEKIVQVPIDLPEPIKETVMSRLKDKLASVIQQNLDSLYDKSIYELFSPEPNIFEACVTPFVNNMRDVNRLVNVFMLRYQVLQDDVELKDLLGITSLEVFNPDLYRWIIVNKDYLCDAQDFKSQERQDHLNAVKQHLETMPSSDKGAKERNLQAVESLFPSVVCAVNDNNMNPSIKQKVTGRKIRRPEHFNAYFRLSIESGLLHESVYKKFLINDPLNKKDLNQEHWKIVTSRGFEGEPEKYLSRVKAARCAKVISFCLELEAKYGNDYSRCVSYDVATALINKTQAGKWIDMILQAIIDSESPVSMIVAACLAFEINNLIQLEESVNKNVQTADQESVASNGAMQVMQVKGQELAELAFSNKISKQMHKLNHLAVQSFYWDEPSSGWAGCLALLRGKLKRTDCQQPQRPLNGPLLQSYADIIPVVLDNIQDKYEAFQSFRRLVDKNAFVDYVLDALVRESGNEYIVDTSLLKCLVTCELLKSALDSWKSVPVLHNVTGAAAYTLALKSPDPAQPVSRQQAKRLVNQWEKRWTEEVK